MVRPSDTYSLIGAYYLADNQGLFVIPAGQREELQGWAQSRSLPAGYVFRARLILALAEGETAANNGGLTYLVDPVGNRLSLTSTLAALPNQTFTYDADNQLQNNTYDSNGNTLASGGHAFAYDFKNRLTQFDSSVQMTYDGDGNRITRIQSGSATR